MTKAHIGSDFDSFLQQDGLLAECEAGALRRVVTWQITQEMKRRRISRAKLASRMKTSRTTLGRLFAEDETPLTIQLLERTALLKDGKAYVQAGGGWVNDSEPEVEFQETVNKRKAMLKAVALAETFAKTP